MVNATPRNDPELRLPRISSLALMLMLNGMSHLTIFIILPTANLYTEYLGGSAVFSGLIIGIPSLFAGLSMGFLVRIDKGTYTGPVIFSCLLAILGNILYGLAYRADFLWLIFIGRCVAGIGLVSFMYTKRYVTDVRIVGIRRRASVSAWLVVGQNVGFTVGPFVGGLLYKVGFHDSVFNGYSSPGWVLAVGWLLFLIFTVTIFEDAPRPMPMHTLPTSSPIPLESQSIPGSVGEGFRTDEESSPVDEHEDYQVTWRTWALVFTMSWLAMTCFFVVGAWQALIAPYTTVIFHWSPFAAGNFMALGGLCTFPFLFVNVYSAQRVQDRYILVYGCTIGFCGLFIMLLILHFEQVNFGSFFVAWFLVALGFSIATTATVSLLSKQMPQRWNGRLSMAIQYGNYVGRVCGTVWGGAALQVGMLTSIGVDMAVLGLGVIMIVILWKDMKSKVG